MIEHSAHSGLGQDAAEEHKCMQAWTQHHHHCATTAFWMNEPLDRTERTVHVVFLKKSVMINQCGLLSIIPCLQAHWLSPCKQTGGHAFSGLTSLDPHWDSAPGSRISPLGKCRFEFSFFVLLKRDVFIICSLCRRTNSFVAFQNAKIQMSHWRSRRRESERVKL